MQITSSRTLSQRPSPTDTDRARQLEQDRRKSQSLKAEIAALERYAADIDKQELSPEKAKQLRDQTQKKIENLKAQLVEAESQSAKKSSPSEADEVDKKKIVGKNKKNDPATADAADSDKNENIPPYLPGTATAQKRDARNKDKSEISVSDEKQMADLNDRLPAAESQGTRRGRKNKSVAPKHIIAEDVYDVKGKTVASQKGVFVDTKV
ncbi:hypothetical protein PQR63_11655 [Herbaspirillum rhizosphaerae]|uniref:Uncharacterized protein n=1 Tax=Herbaspirillum rhizosphaerae TaxID=346179 RepID=A0ABW8Z9S9_9BURK